MAILSILAMYEYDPTLFDGLTVPTAADITTDADKISDPFIPNKQDLVDLICMECAELELVYVSLPTLKKMITIWSDTHIDTWRALYNTLIYKYNPIWNKDGTYTETRELDTRGTTSGTGQHDVTGFDSNAYSPDTQDKSNSSGTGHELEKLTRTESGNIGVTTTQKMIEEQRELVKFNLYDTIAQDFKRQFCLMVY